MTFRSFSSLLALLLTLLGMLLLLNGGYCLWEYHSLAIFEAVERDAHGMSRVVGYTFVVMLGAVNLGLGAIAWSSRHVLDPQSQSAIGLAYFIFGVLASALSLYMQIVYWQAGWGRLYAVIFLVVTLLATYFRFLQRREIRD